MEKDLNNSVDQNSSHLNGDDAEKSFVGKFKSIISNTPLSKWFRKQDDNVRSVIRQRDDENDDEIHQMQPPAKRAKFPNVGGNGFNNLLSTSNSDNTIISEKLSNTTYNYFPEPVAGPSGMKSRKLNSVTISANSVRNMFTTDNLVNGPKDSDSEESTSGYSSVVRIGSKEHVSQSDGSSKQHSPSQNNSTNTRSLFQSPAASTNRTLFTEGTSSPNMNTSLSSRRPCFNASTFGSPNFIDKTISTEKIINSPFYNGTTIYGGASAYGSKLVRSSRDMRASLKRSFHIKPVNKAKESGNTVLGKTARKILETLEQYNSPVNDAKKIPVASKRFRPDDSLLGKHIGVNPYVSKSKTASNKELQVPTVSDLLKLKQKAKLQSSTETVRQIAIPSKTDTITVSSQPVINTVEKSQKLDRFEKVDESKGMAKNTVHNDKPEFGGLPVSNIPKFNLNIPSTTKKSPEKVTSITEKSSFSPISKSQNIQDTRTTPQVRRDSQRKVTTIASQYKFSDPLIISENLKSIVAMNNFKFSEPLYKMNKKDHGITLTPPITKAVKEKNNGQNNIKEVLSNPVSLDKFKPSAGTWECESCLIRNQADKTKCIACEAPNPKLKTEQSETKKPVITSTPSFGEGFKLPQNMWECPVCMIRNSNDSAKCVACETANPKSTTLVSSSSSSGFQGKFQPPANTWECTTCMIRNKEELSKCAACETPKIPQPASNQLVNSFKIKDDEWECSVCMVRNKSTHSKCQCCEASKPGTSSNVVVQENEKKPVPKFNFGIDQKTAASFSFGIPPSSTTPSLPKPVVEPVLTFGDQPKAVVTPAVPTFSFGVNPSKQKEEKPKETANSDKPVETTKSTEVPQVIAPVKPVEVNKPNAKDVTVKPLFGLVEKTGTNTIPLGVDKSTSAIKPATSLNTTNTLGSTDKPSFNFSVNFDKKGKDTTFAASMPKFDFGKSIPNLAKEVVTTTASQATTPVFSFGASKSVKSTNPPVFGQDKLPTNNGLDIKSTPSFGAPVASSLEQASTKPVEAKPFSFTKPDSGEPASKAPMFNFGQSASSSTNPTAQSSGFSFGPVAKSPVFNFSASKSESTVGSTSSNLFGGSNTTGNSKNGVFNFGSATQNSAPQKAGFNFGAFVAPPSTGFNFNAAGTAAPTPTPPARGFNFTAAFDSTAKPSFNFSDSPVSFSAQPLADGALPAPRKIKKAVRKAR